MMGQKEILIRAITHYSAEHQKRKAVEELSELIVELAREADGRSSDADIITEIADARIMLAQLTLLYGETDVDAEIERKLARLEKRISE